MFRHAPSNFNPVTTMRIKILSLSVVIMVGWALSAPSASAFSLLPQCFRHDECRPYNAFSPVENRHHGHHGRCRCCCACCCPGPICASVSPMCGGTGCGAAPVYSGPATMTPGEQLQAPAPANPGFTPPPPTPNSGLNQTSMYGGPQAVYGLQPAGYAPYYPSYPMNYYPVNNYPMVPP